MTFVYLPKVNATCVAEGIKISWPQLVSSGYMQENFAVKPSILIVRKEEIKRKVLKKAQNGGFI